MHSRLRRAAALAAIMALLPAGLAQATHLSAQDAALLRYTFTPGAAYAYHMTMTMRMSMSGTGVQAAPGKDYTMSSTTSGLVQYRILKVDASGATAQMTTRNMAMRMTVAGKTTTTTLGAQPQTVHLGLDGTVQGTLSSGSGTSSLESVAALPAGAVAPGARWTGSVTASIPTVLAASMTPLRITTHNVFSHYVQVDGQRAAGIDSTGTLAYTSDAPVQGQTWHMHITAAMQGYETFGLAVHRAVTSRQHVDMRLSMTGPAIQGQTPALSMRFVIAVATTPAGW